MPTPHLTLWSKKQKNLFVANKSATQQWHSLQPSRRSFTDACCKTLMMNKPVDSIKMASWTSDSNRSSDFTVNYKGLNHRNSVNSGAFPPEEARTIEFLGWIVVPRTFFCSWIYFHTRTKKHCKVLTTRLVDRVFNDVSILPFKNDCCSAMLLRKSASWWNANFID